jgi:aryl-alcohol dehydrogenase-like predicted oxidoreductase
VLGRAGQRVSILALGGWHIGTIADEAEAARFMHAALDEGITFFDNAWDYHDGRSEELMGKALAMDGRRQKVFLYALSQPVSSQVVGLTTLEHLNQATALARGFRPLTDDEKASLVARVKEVAGDGRLELFKSSQTFDGPYHRQQQGFTA